MEDLRTKVLDFVKINGPSLPVQITKKISGNLILAGAVMSELVHNKKLKVSRAKIGGSPVYYIEGQESRLNILYKYLNDKEKKAYDLLKDNKVLIDKELEPWQRIALRDLKDFAVMLRVVAENSEEIFWKWHLLTDEEVKPLISSRLSQKNELIQEVASQHEEILENQMPEETSEQLVVSQGFEQEEYQEILPRPRIIKQARQKPAKKLINPFDYFNSKGIHIMEQNIIRNEKEYEFIVKMPTKIGNVNFFVKALDKAKVGDKDLILAHSQSQLKRLPLLFLSNGSLTKKGEEYLAKNHINFDNF